MGKPAAQREVKLIIGFIFKDETALANAQSLTMKRFGPLDFQSQVIDFRYTNYYNQEFGESLKRKFISFKRLRSPEYIYNIKLITNEIEQKLSRFGKRMINIDPGYITEGKVVLLTTKDYSHRVYLKRGIYAESTLRYDHGNFRPWENTYRDYQSRAYIDIFKKVRSLYKVQIKQ